MSKATMRPLVVRVSTTPRSDAGSMIRSKAEPVTSESSPNGQGVAVDGPVGPAGGG